MTLPDMTNTALHNRALAETAPDPIITIDEESSILYVNAGAERVFGYSASEMLGRSLTMLMPERLRERHLAGIRHYVTTGERLISWQGFRVPMCTRSGTEIPVEISFGEFEWNGRRVFSGFIRDISERVANEQALATANAQLQRQTLELERQIGEAQALARELKQAHGHAEVRARLAARAADRARRLLALSTALNQPIGTAEVADLILDTGIAAVSADGGGFALVSYDDEGNGEFEVIRARGFSGGFWADYKQFALRPGRPMSDAVLKRAPVLVESREDARLRYPTMMDFGYEALAALPVMSGQRAAAAIAFGFTRAQVFDEPTETFLRTVGELCAQALKRAQLHDASRRHAQQSAFLAEASRLLSSSLDYEATLKSMAQAAVPSLADWCIVDVMDDPTANDWPPRLSRIAVVHNDPEREAIATSLGTRVPIDWSSNTGLAAALRQGKSQFVPVIADELKAGGAEADEHLALLRDLGYSSAIIVPLLARGHRLGALTLLLMSDSGRRYDKDDLALATDLAARAATAIDNARLFRDAQHARTVAEHAVTRADAASKAKSNFLATMSHEIRTPINAVLGYAELLEMELAGPLTAEQHAQLARIRVSTGHLLTLVNEVLDLAKIESGTLRVNVAESIAGETANAALELVSPQAAAKGIAITEACEGACGARYVGDTDRVRQILANLVANAVKFTKPGGSVSLSCSVVTDPPARGLLRPGAYVAFRISDTGVGIRADELESIFEAFVQSESMHRSPYTREQTGTGLGLAISRQLANRMGGEITVQSKPGVGSTFTLYMPAA